jgi:peptidoglycan-N-acetylglucosamine deacetylase
VNKIALSFDLEDWYHTPVITGYTFSKYKNVNDFFNEYNNKYDFLTEGFIKLFELLERKKIIATFFIVADILERYPEIYNMLLNSNHEIACHSLNHQIPYNPQTKKFIQSQKEWEKELLTSKKIIEKRFSKEVIGYRAPGAFFFDWMIEILENAGFKYDSSIAFNSFYNKTNIKLLKIPSHPYYINSENLSISKNKYGLMELPWSYYKFNNIFLPGGGAFFFRALGVKYFKSVIKNCLKMGDTMFYIHPLEFTSERFPSHNHFKRPLYWVNKGDKALNMLEKLIDSFNGRWTTCNEIYLNNKL